MTTVEPTHNWLVNGERDVAVSVESDLDIATLTVTATMGEESVPLVDSAEAICDERDCAPGFWGHVSLDGLPSGVHALTVNTVDVEDMSISKQRDVRLEKKPVLDVAKPLNLTSVTDTIPLT